MISSKGSKTGLPSWHRKSQKAYRVNRYIIYLQIAAALAMCVVILYGITKVMN